MNFWVYISEDVQKIGIYQIFLACVHKSGLTYVWLQLYIYTET